jgi:UDP-GlcNAc:undecaprenyl-phosphate GlcNAc-1-phosphate transferase
VGIAIVLACAITAGMTFWVRKWATRLGVVDVPGGRHVHAHVTPRLGGVAIIVGFFAPLAVLMWAETAVSREFAVQSSRVAGLVFGGFVVGVVGAVDDVRGLGPWRKLLAQAIAASIAYYAGYRIDAVNLPWLGEISFGWFAYPVTLFWFLGITNAINLIDGLDGLAAGVALFACASNLVLAFFNELHVVALLSACLAGALIGFLRYNFSPATIFMGDSGSMFIGFALAATSLVGATVKGSTAIGILAPVIALGIPIFDTMLAVLRRTLARQPIFQADRAHLHHKLVDMGLTHRTAVLVLYFGSIALAISALGVAIGRDWQVGVALATVFVTMVTVVRVAGGFGLGSSKGSVNDLHGGMQRAAHSGLRSGDSMPAGPLPGGPVPPAGHHPLSSGRA